MDSALSPEYQLALEANIDLFSPTEVFVCLFCPFECSDPVEILSHLLTSHNFEFTNLERIPFLPAYLQHWRIHVPPLISVNNRQTIDITDPSDQSLRLTLHQLRLQGVMQEHEFERTATITEKCLFCAETFTGTWHGYLQYLFEQHQFNPGRPSNLIFIPHLIEKLRHQLDGNICIYCQCEFPNQRTLRSHMRKKKHMRVPATPTFDRYYMVNYLEMDQSWQSIEEDDEDNFEYQETLEEAALDFDETETLETVCLICDQIFSQPEECVVHMRQVHKFDLSQIRKAVDGDFYNCVRFVNHARYQKSQGKCFVCGEDVVEGDFASHIEIHENKVPADISTIYGEDQLLIPFIDGDPLLTILEED